MTTERGFLYCSGLKGFGSWKSASYYSLTEVKVPMDIAVFEDKAITQVAFGLMCAYCDSISFEMEIHAPNQEELVRNIWNAQWDLLQIGTEMRSTVVPLFQGRESFTSGVKSSFDIYNSRYFSFLSGDGQSVRSENLKTVDESRAHFRALMKNGAFTTAVSIYLLHSRHPNRRIAMSLVWSAVEGLIGFDHELRFRIALGLSKLLHRPSERLEKFKLYTKLYDARSKCVHGATEPKDLEDHVSASQELLGDLLTHLVRRGSLLQRPDWETLFLE